MKKHINIFNKGLNRDYSKNKFPNDAYYNAEGLRLITNDGLSSFALRNIEGDLYAGALHSGSFIHGPQAWTILRDKLIILSIGDNPGVNDRIISFELDSSGDLHNRATLYEGNLEFDPAYPIKKVIGRYESPDIQKIYWTQGNTGIRFCNIADSTLSTYTTSQFNIIPSFNIVPIEVQSIGTGSLKSGMVHYTYQLYNLYGAESYLTPPTNLIPLSPFSSSGNDALFTGGKENEGAGKSVTLSLTGLDTNFNRIKIIRIHHTSLLADPTITIIEDTVLSANMTFTDNGTQNLGSYTLEEFITLKYDFLCQDIETKNNLLFAANITENIWDIGYDARAYRYNGAASPTCYIYSEDGVSDEVSFTLTQLMDGSVVVPETHDCFTLKNNISLDTGAVFNNYRYKGNGLTIGGQGKHVSYTFSTEAGIIDDAVSILTNTDSTVSSNVNSIRVSEKISFMRDEIYSFGIVLNNDKGQKSYVKWVGDIRFPSVFDNSFDYFTSQGVAYYNLYINFTITNLPTDCVSYQIVRCERKSEDRTILAQGLVGATRTYTGTTTWQCPAMALPTVAGYNESISSSITRNQLLNKRLIEFISPEISYGNTIDFVANDVLELNNTLIYQHQFVKVTNTSTGSLAPFIDYASTNFNYNYEGLPYLNNVLDVSITVNKLATFIVPTRSRRKVVVNDFKKVNYTTSSGTDETIIPGNQTTVDTYTFENYIRKRESTKSMQGLHGTTGIVAIASDLDFSSIIEYPENSITYPYGRTFATANYKRNIKPYGGASYEARTRREYISCSEVTLKATSTILVTSGDTYISYFEFQRAFVAGLIGNSNIVENIVEIYKFPVESSINTRWQSNKTFTQFYTNNTGNPINTNAIIIQEPAGAYSKNNGGVIANFTQEQNLYSYNSVYSKQNNVVKFQAKPLDFITNKVFDCRVIYSDRKFNNEPVDSWATFKVLNFKDVDSQYGPINALTNYNEDLIYLQDNGFGVLSVEERELLQGSNATQLTTGTGGILSRYDYVSTNGGCKHPNSILRGKYGMYFYDRGNNSLFSFLRNGGDTNLSKMLGVQSFLNKNIVGIHSLPGDSIQDVVAGYNSKYNEVLFTFKATTWPDGNYKTIVFNEKDKQFSRIDQVNPEIYINGPGFTHSTYLSNESLYLQNGGEFGYFGRAVGGLAYHPSKISVLINPDGVLVNRFDLIQWITEFSNSNHKTFDTIRFYNDWQDSGEITLVEDSNLFYIFRTWRFNQFFDSLEQRIKDSYLIVELKFINANNDKLVVHDLITTYSPTAPW